MRPALSDERFDELIRQHRPEFVFKTYLLSSRQISLAISRGVDLGYLYEHQNLNQININKAIKRGRSLEVLYKKHKLSQENISMAISEGYELGMLYKYQQLNSKNIGKAIDCGYELPCLYSHQVLSEADIRRIINVNRFLEIIIERQQLSEKIIDEFIGKSEYWWLICKYQKLTTTQIDRICEMVDREECKCKSNWHHCRGKNRLFRIILEHQALSADSRARIYIRTSSTDIKKKALGSHPLEIATVKRLARKKQASPSRTYTNFKAARRSSWKRREIMTTGQP